MVKDVTKVTQMPIWGVGVCLTVCVCVCSISYTILSFGKG